MSNLHGFNDYRGQSGPGGGGGGGGPAYIQPQQRPASGNQNMMMLGGGGGGGGEMFPPISKVIAPDFQRNSFIFIVTVIQILVFFIELILGGALPPHQVFDPTNNMAGPGSCIMIKMGAKWLPLIRLKAEVYRLFTPIFLHAGILHIFTNMLTQTIICYTYEKLWGTWKIMAFYFVAGIGASLLSCVGAPGSLSVGASGSLLGMIGCHISFLFMNWNNTDKVVQPCPQLCCDFVWLFIIMLMGLGEKGIDNMAHLGGLISGLLLGMAFHECDRPMEVFQGKETIIKYVGLLLTSVWFVMMVAGTFWLVNLAALGLTQPGSLYAGC